VPERDATRLLPCSLSPVPTRMTEAEPSDEASTTGSPGSTTFPCTATGAGAALTDIEASLRPYPRHKHAGE